MITSRAFLTHIKHFSIRSKDFREFKKLEKEIVHFEQVKITEEKREEIQKKIKQVLENKKESELEYNDVKLKFKYLTNHYYIPVVMLQGDKEKYIKHVIDVESETKFIEELEKYLESEDNIFKEFDWWYFSKIDETLDEVYIPYYNDKSRGMAKFKPDFIFWCKRGHNYIILFVDPKGTEHADAYRKIDGYSRIFEEKKNGIKKLRVFLHNESNVIVKLFLKVDKGDLSKVPEEYRDYWFDHFSEFTQKLKETLSLLESDSEILKSFK